MASAPENLPPNMRTLRVLEVLGQSDEAMTATEINQAIGLPKQTVHRLCTSLEEAGFLIREGDGRRYRPSRRSRLMGSGLLHASRSHIVRRQVLLDVAAAVGETVNFVVAEENGMRYLDRVETDWPFRIQLDIGSNVPFHCTASGKTFLASLKPVARGKFIEALTPEPVTPNTLTDPDALLTELKQISKNGYALDREEFMEGMIAVAVPVKDPDGRFIAALAFHGPRQRITIEEAVAKKEILMEGAERLRASIF